MRPSIRTSILVPGFIATPSTRLITWDSVRELHIGIVFFPVRTRNAFCVSEKIGSERSATPLGRLVGLPDKSFRFVTQKDSVAEAGPFQSNTRAAQLSGAGDPRVFHALAFLYL